MTYHVEIERDPRQRTYDVYLFNDTPTGSSYALPQEITMQAVSEGEMPSAPWLRLGHRDAQSIFEALSKALQRTGFETEDQSFTKGKLDATEHHLEDLREMLDLKAPDA